MKTTTYSMTLAESARALDRLFGQKRELQTQLREVNRQLRQAQEQLLVASRQGSKEHGR